MIKVIRQNWRIPEILKFYQGDPRKPTDLHTIEDLLTDLRFFCDEEGFDFYALLDSSYQAYLKEKQV